MKKCFLIIVILLSSIRVFTQVTDIQNQQYNEIIKLLKSFEYHEAILKIDTYLQTYRYDASMYFNRGLSYYHLNDYSSARKDFLKARELGFMGRDQFIKFVTSESYIVDMVTKGYLSDIKLSPENGFKLVYGKKDSLRGELRPERTCFDVYFYDLTVKIIPKSRSIEGSNDIYFTTTENTDKIQLDLFRAYRIKSIQWNGKALEYKRVYNAIFINFGEVLPANQKNMITIEYFGKPIQAPNPPWNGGFVWKKERSKWWVGVACEHLGASSWWPCKDHLSDKPDSMQINIQVPGKYQAVANGNLRSVNPIDKKYTNFEWFVSYPINSYCVTFYMGKFVNFNEVYSNSNGSYNIDYYVLPRHLETAKKYYRQTKDIVRVYEKLFGEYPYKKDGLAMVEAPFEGMEHQSAIAIGAMYDSERDGVFKNSDYSYIVVHETAHEWWGNAVTMADMADAWISEGFATYSENLFQEEIYGYKEYNLAVANYMAYILNIWPMVGIKDVNDNSFLGNDIYSKGATMLHNLRCTINNDSTFFAMIKKFYHDHRFKQLETKDFIHFVNEYTGHDYTDFFNKFLYDTEPPILEYSYTLIDGLLTFTYKWINVGSNFTMPFNITLDDDRNFRVDCTTESQSLNIMNVQSFYLPNDKKFTPGSITKNSFTYYWTSWKK